MQVKVDNGAIGTLFEDKIISAEKTANLIVISKLYETFGKSEIDAMKNKLTPESQKIFGYANNL